MKITQQYIKNTNLSLIYSIIRNNPGTSRVLLAKETGLSKTTVSSLVEELIQKNFIVDTGTSESNIVGRKPKHLYPTGNRHCVLVINWTPGLLTAALVDLEGNVSRKHSITINQPSNYCSYLKELIAKLEPETLNGSELLATCIILSAMIDKSTSKIISTTLGIDPEEDMISNIRNLLPGTALAFFNDTACLAYAEKIYSEIDENPFAFINLDQGIGAALFVDGKMLGDASGMQTQFGHYSVDPNGRPCPCGNHGCLEMMIGERMLGELLRDCQKETPAALEQNPRFLEIGLAAARKEPLASHALSTIAGYLSIGLSNLISLMRPGLIVIGGSGVHLGEEFLEKLTQQIRSHGFQKMVDKVQIRFSSLSEDACLQGAMQYFFHTYYSFTDDIQDQTFLG